MSLYTELDSIYYDLNNVVGKTREAVKAAGRMEELQSFSKGALVLKYADHIPLRNQAERLLNYKDVDGKEFVNVIQRALHELERLQKERAQFQEALAQVTGYISKEAGQ